MVASVRRYLPRGDALPEATWAQRHRAILILVWLHAAILPVIGVLTHHTFLHVAWEASIVAGAAVVAGIKGLQRSTRMVAATFGLITSSALLVHFSEGLIEMHFHFFVMVAVVTLYQSWLPFLLALGYVVLHHGTMGALDPGSVYNHPAAIANPWKWALVHGFFIFGESAALLVVWRMNEDARNDATGSYEQQLEAQGKYRQIFENSVEGIYEVSLEDGSFTVNPAVARMVGYNSVEELVASGTDLASVQVDSERGAELRRLVADAGSVAGFEYQIRRINGELRWVSNNARAVRDEHGRLTGIQGTVEDITERKWSEKMLKEREEQFRLLFESNPLPMWVYDTETLEYLAVNTAAINHYGYSRSEFLDMCITDIRPEEDKPAFLEHVQKKRLPLSTSGPWRHLTADGHVLDVEIKSHTLDFRGRPAALTVVEDVTERYQAERQRQKLENQLRQAQKMEAVGELAGGIAHDFNNILSVIINYATFLKEDLEPDDPRLEDIEEIRTAGERGAKLVRQVLAFSRKEITDPQVMCINTVVAELENLLRRSIGEDVRLEMKLGDDVLPVRADPTQLEQVLVNLAINARDAMKQGGKLVIETARVLLDEAVAAAHPEIVPGEYVSLIVSDTGEGMTEEVKARIFEPFYSTKPLGEGSGLGLAMVYGIVKRSNGYIYVYSEPGIGTTVRIYLPATPEQGNEAPIASPKASTSNAGIETVLLVEDEPAVRSLATRILAREGYEVMEAGNANEALEVYRARRGDIDLLLTDVIMPGMSGKELSDQLRDLGNGIKTLYMSGYTDEIITERGMLNESEELIQKPFTAEGLLSKVREVLES